MKPFRYLDLITAAMVAVLIISNIASTKVVLLEPFTFDGGTILFPLAYIFGDVLTEVYGYKRARRVIWIGFGLLVLSALTFALVNSLPAPTDEGSKRFADAFSTILGSTPRIVLASLMANWVGEFVNSYVLARLKVRTQGRFLALRTIGSTLIGQGLDTALFLLIAFAGVWSPALIWTVFLSNYVFKVGVEVLLTPITYAAVGFLKRSEHQDHYDRDTSFNPFAA